MPASLEEEEEGEEGDPPFSFGFAAVLRRTSFAAVPEDGKQPEVSSTGTETGARFDVHVLVSDGERWRGSSRKVERSRQEGFGSMPAGKRTFCL